LKRLAVIAFALLLTGCAGAGQATSNTTVAATTSTTSTTSAPVDPIISRAEAILKDMTLKQKASQVFLVRFRGRTMDGDGNAGLLVNDGPYGGFVFIQGNIGGGDTIRALTTSMQEAAKATGSPLKLFITTDQEGGISRITAAVPRVPYANELGKTSTPEHAGELAAQTAQGLTSLGLNMNLAPVADVAPLDSYIGKRSFGNDPAKVSAFISAVVQGYQQNGVIAVVKQQGDRHRQQGSLRAEASGAVQGRYRGGGGRHHALPYHCPGL
jgi:beta-N-acetylhexosaminidase